MTSQVSKAARQRYGSIVFDAPAVVQIPGTKRRVRIRNIHPYTLERLTKLWLERDAQMPTDSGETLKSACIDPYFGIKEAVILSLNCWWKIILLYPLKWRIWAYLREYTDEQMLPIIQEGKKKLPLMPHWMIMAFSTDMRTDWKRMTTKEAEQYRAELLSEAKRLSSKSSPATADTAGA